jgi:glycosyltransferase involved in cell wall biosynthesis
MQNLTVIIPTYNEEAYLTQALQSVDFATQIIVVDSNSTDHTAEIAKSFGCELYFRAFDNFSNQKNFALQYAKHDWILFLDADERITKSLQEEIKHTLEFGTKSGYKLNFPHFYMNRFLYHHDDNVLRLVKRDNCKFTGKVHEKLEVSGAIGQLKNPVLHYTYKGFIAYIQKKDSYAWFQAQQLLEKGKKATYFHLCFKPFYRFFSSYILRGGIFDGIPGFTVASVNAYGVFSRYVKLMLLQRGLK